MQTLTITDAQAWDKALAQIPSAHVLQSWAWGEIKARHGWTPLRLLFTEGSTICAAAQVLRRPLPRTPFVVMYIPKGPALNFDDTELFRRVLGALEETAKQQRAIFIKIDPDIPRGHADAAVLAERKWQVSAEQIQFRNSVNLDLARSEDDILAGMKPKWRYNLRLAERKGVQVRIGDIQDLATFYELYAETSGRDGFLIRPFGYYQDVWETMLRAGEADLLLAQVDGENVAGLMLFYFAKRAWYFYGASRNTHRDWMPNHLLQWEAMRRAKAQGCSEYDFWGAPDELVETAPMYGVYKFKMGFGGEFVERIPAHDFVVNPALYWAYAVVRPKYLARLRGQSRITLGE